MILKDLIKSVVFDDVWAELNKEYYMKDGALEAYLRVFNQLKELTQQWLWHILYMGLHF